MRELEAQLFQTMQRETARIAAENTNLEAALLSIKAYDAAKKPKNF